MRNLQVWALGGCLSALRGLALMKSELFSCFEASEVSSLQSGWREDYWKEPSSMFTQGLLSQERKGS